MNNNLITKRIGINDHFPIDKYSKAMFPDNAVYTDIINNNTNESGFCMKNIYKSDEWIKEWIKHKWNKELGKENAYYVYNIFYDGVGKPVKKYINNDIDTLYKRANGVMYYDFDNIGKDIVDIIKVCFNKVSLKEHAFQWFEKSWSGNGCHIRVKYKLKFNNKYEWQFIYMYYLDVLMKKLSEYIDVSKWYYDNTIDWSCSNISRGFAIPYNEEGVYENKNFEENYSMPYNTLKELQIFINTYSLGYWNNEIKNKFLHNIGHTKYIDNKRFINKYNIDKIDIDNIVEQSGEKFDYNWRLKCVTTLMNIYNYDKDKVRNACRFIYSFIKPYKNHTYEEMIGNELENKIFANGNMTLFPSEEIIDDLRKYFGFNISKTIKTNEVYISDILQTL